MDKVQFSLSVIVIKEGASFVAYSPSLDLSTAADTFDAAKKRFEEAVQIFFEEITQKGTADKALTELGWQKQNNEYFPPMIVGSQTESFSVPSFSN
jgi:predicted RNase H-like HicB family nuclease